MKKKNTRKGVFYLPTKIESDFFMLSIPKSVRFLLIILEYHPKNAQRYFGLKLKIKNGTIEQNNIRHFLKISTDKRPSFGTFDRLNQILFLYILFIIYIFQL